MNFMRNNFFRPAWSILFVLLLFSCQTKKYIYLKDMKPLKEYNVSYNKRTVIREDDRIGISVFSKTPELAIPFNVKTGNIHVSDAGDISAETAHTSKAEKNGYLVDADGNIDFPVLGILPVKGLTLKELEERIKTKIIKENYIKDPIVTAEFLNFTFYALGEVTNRGRHSVPTDRLTLLEAISLVGDVTANGRADKVSVIRRKGDTNQIIVNNLESHRIFSSPAFYLQQNDIIYVESAKRSTNPNIDNTLRYISFATSTITSVFTLILLLKK